MSALAVAFMGCASIDILRDWALSGVIFAHSAAPFLRVILCLDTRSILQWPSFGNVDAVCANWR